MCFYLHEKHPAAKVARRDIVCYKKACAYNPKTQTITPYFRIDYRYRLGKVQPKVDLIVLPSGFDPRVIKAGYHSYSNKKKIRSCRITVKCIIPKGTKYYYNPDRQEYVSETIIIQERLIKR